MNNELEAAQITLLRNEVRPFDNEDEALEYQRELREELYWDTHV